MHVKLSFSLYDDALCGRYVLAPITPAAALPPTPPQPHSLLCTLGKLQTHHLPTNHQPYGANVYKHPLIRETRAASPG